MYFFEVGTSSEQPLFQKFLVQKKNFFRSRYFLKRVAFSGKLVLRDQFHSIYTWKDFSLTNIYSFKYIMIWKDLEIPLLFIVENSKQCINFNIGCVTNVFF